MRFLGFWIGQGIIAGLDFGFAFALDWPGLLVGGGFVLGMAFHPSNFENRYVPDFLATIRGVR